MGERLMAFSAVFPIVIKETEGVRRILLHRRQNTGYQDGKWDIAGSGHVDEGETARSAVVRECGEELGIDVKSEDLTFIHLCHRITPKRTYYDIYFIVNKYENTPVIMEPEKCSELKWFALDSLPDDIIECRRAALNAYKDKLFYSDIIE